MSEVWSSYAQAMIKTAQEVTHRPGGPLQERPLEIDGKQYDAHQLKEIEEGGKRFYLTPDGKKIPKPTEAAVQLSAVLTSLASLADSLD